MDRNRFWLFLMIGMVLVGACQPRAATTPEPSALGDDEQSGEQPYALTPAGMDEKVPVPTYPSRPRYEPGELVDYNAQTGDTLPNLAARFNTTVEEIQAANPFIPESATTMPPGMPVKIPIYHLPLWGSPYQILPDSMFVNGPSQTKFDTVAFVNSKPGWLKEVVGYVGDSNKTGAEIIDYVAQNYSLSPRLLLALLEYQARALSQPVLTPELEKYPLGYQNWRHEGLYPQLIWAANVLNNGYYGFRQSQLLSIEHDDGRIERFDPWQNAATISLHHYFNFLFDTPVYARAISPEGFAKTYEALFGDPWLGAEPHIPGSLTQPEFILPFEPGETWAYTGGPHTGYGVGEPFAALDFAPPSKAPGCIPTRIWTTAVAPGVIVRSSKGEVVLDLDGDGDERTGWNIYYLHVGSLGRVKAGTTLERGERIGHPSCEGGTSTGTHVHLARKYNGEWLPAEGILPFNLEGWIPHNGNEPYLGTLTRGSQSVTACTCSNAASWVQSDRPVPDKVSVGTPAAQED